MLPILHTWASAGHQSLREITRKDILDALPAQANQHRQALTALRALFRFLKGRRVIFVDPARGCGTTGCITASRCR